MNTDPRAHDLLSRVSSDVSLLRQDIKSLFRHTTKHTLPTTAREIADCARTRLQAGRDYTTEHLRALGTQLNRPCTAWVGGAVVVGLLAAGTYWFLKSDRNGDDELDYEGEEEV
ncbi:MAG: hypothetical protein V4733_08375 [Verrucomicrobiota bacterium]